MHLCLGLYLHLCICILLGVQCTVYCECAHLDTNANTNLEKENHNKLGEKNNHIEKSNRQGVEVLQQGGLWGQGGEVGCN